MIFIYLSGDAKEIKIKETMLFSQHVKVCSFRYILHLNNLSAHAIYFSKVLFMFFFSHKKYNVHHINLPTTIMNQPNNIMQPLNMRRGSKPFSYLQDLALQNLSPKCSAEGPMLPQEILISLLFHDHTHHSIPPNSPLQTWQ